MTTFESNVKQIAYPQQTVYDTLSDLTHLQGLKDRMEAIKGQLTDEQRKQAEQLNNEYIQAKAPVVCEEMTVAEAKAQGAIGLFESKYGERVKVYTMGAFSKEICGGPHATNTGDLVSFKIKKEEASSAGVRRIKGTIGK